LGARPRLARVPEQLQIRRGELGVPRQPGRQVGRALEVEQGRQPGLLTSTLVGPGSGRWWRL
jgi:hypothetical protein